MNNPLISICVINYNNSRFLPDLFDSIIHQTYKNIEVVFCDDKSTDNSIELFKQSTRLFPKTFNTTPIYRSINSGGAIVPIFDALRASSGDYICILDGDDFIHPQFIEVLYDMIAKNHCDISSVNNGSFKDVSEIKVQKYTPKHLLELPVTLHSTKDIIPRLFMDTTIDVPFERWHRLYSKEVISRICKMPLRLFNTNGDSDISLATFMESKIMAYRDIPLHFWRVNDDSVTHKSRLGFIEKYAYGGLGPMVEYYTQKSSNNKHLADLYSVRQSKIIAWMFETAKEEKLPLKEYHRIYNTYTTKANRHSVADILTGHNNTLKYKLLRASLKHTPLLYYLSR